MKIYKQSIQDTDLVSIASFKELRFDFWKGDNKKYLDEEIEADNKLKKASWNYFQTLII